jgi:hypothetical protein
MLTKPDPYYGGDTNEPKHFKSCVTQLIIEQWLLQ